MSELETLLKSITPVIYNSLKRAIELSKWPNGQRLTKEQKELCMQAIISYEHKNLEVVAHTGYIPPKPHEHCADDVTPDVEKPLTWVNEI